MKYHALFSFLFKKRHNLKLSSAGNYRWRFKGLIGLDKKINIKLKLFSYPSGLTFVLGAQKNRIIERNLA